MNYKDVVTPSESPIDTDFFPISTSHTLGADLQRFASIEAMLKNLRPAQSVQCLYPEKLEQAAQLFIKSFPGHTLYAIKANPDPYILTKLYAAGISHFDVASLGEVKLVREMFPNAHLAFMNPVKSREAIRAAYFTYGVRDFVVDTEDEINKIIEETDHASDILIVVRLAMPKGSAAYALTSKFGCSPDTGVHLLKYASTNSARVGLSFHVGSQTLDPSSYATAIRMGGEVAQRSGIKLSVFDIGGGFPIAGLGMDIPPLTTFFDVIRQEIAQLKLPKGCQIWAEPGRALSGDCSVLVVRVELRKDDLLYLNDGTYGNMFEICTGHWRNNATLYRSLRKGKPTSKKISSFRFYGPTCDSVDYMAGPFMLPDDVAEGDWIALQGMGAYMAASQTRFNGFYSDTKVEIVSSPSSKKRTHLKVVK